MEHPSLKSLSDRVAEPLSLGNRFARPKRGWQLKGALLEPIQE
jgi:hypothetical protein